MVAALAAGAGTAVLASGAGSPPMITLGDNPGKALRVYGSSGDDTITFGGFTEGITVAGRPHDHQPPKRLRRRTHVLDERAFCDTGAGATRRSTPDSRRRPTRSRFYKSFDAPGFRIIGRGGSGGDSLSGAEKKDEFKGGPAATLSSAWRATTVWPAAAAPTPAMAAPATTTSPAASSEAAARGGDGRGARRRGRDSGRRLRRKCRRGGVITLTGATEKRLTILGSGQLDAAVRSAGEAAGNVVLNADRASTNMRTDCTTMGPATTNAVCDSEFTKIDADFGKSPDKLVFKDFDVQGLIRVLAKGAGGGDTLHRLRRRATGSTAVAAATVFAAAQAMIPSPPGSAWAPAPTTARVAVPGRIR